MSEIRVPLSERCLVDGRIGGVQLEQIAAEFGTPAYIYDLDLIERRATFLRDALPPLFELAYAIKANPSPAILARLARLGLGADVASGGELAAALRAGFAPERIVFTGPGKRDTELASAVDAGIGAITVESLGELERLQRIAVERGRTVPILLRASTPGDSSSHDVMAGAHAKFGMRHVDLLSAAEIASQSSAIELLGIHAFGASNVLESADLLAHARRTINLAIDVELHVGSTLPVVNVGGGLGIPYGDERPLDIGTYILGLAQLAADGPAGGGVRRIIVEPGRCIVGPAGVYVCRVLDTKQTDNGPIAILDGGIHHFLRPALIGRPHPIEVISSGEPSNSGERVVLAGPLCTGMDVLGSVDREVRVGDLVAFEQAGAYGFTESMPFFLSHPLPGEVGITDRATMRLPTLSQENSPEGRAHS